MAQDQITISVIVSTYNNPDYLNRVLSGISKQTLMPLECVIAEDGEDRETKSEVEKWKAVMDLPIKHITQRDDGFRKSMILNKGIGLCTGNYIVFLDGDCVPEIHFVEDHLRLATPGHYVQGRRAMVQKNGVDGFDIEDPSILRRWLRGEVKGILKGVRFPWCFKKINREMYGILGCNMGIWKSDLEAVNGFDEKFEGWGREDSDLVVRLYNSGITRIMVYGRSVVYHLDHPVLARDQLKENDDLLRNAKQLKKIKCEVGLDQYLDE